MDIFIAPGATTTTSLFVSPVQEESYSGNKVYIPDAFLLAESSVLISATTVRLKPAPVSGWISGG